MKSSFCVRFGLKLAVIVLLIFFLDFCGILIPLLELNYDKYFHCTYKGSTPKSDNPENYDYPVLSYPHQCNTTEAHIVFIIKSAINNRKQRDLIRRTWGHERKYLNISTQRFFVLGKSESVDEMQLLREEKHYNDIVQFDFIDTYFNNTIKTVSAIRWVSQYCPQTAYVAFIDDDYYVSVMNLLRFIDHSYRTQYAFYSPDTEVYDIFRNSYKNKNFELYAGYVFESRPHRHKFSKWYVSLKEYPFNKWPPYVTAGAFVLSNKAINKIVEFSKRVQHFRFDDVYLGIVAAVARIPLTHSNGFHFYKPKLNRNSSCREIIAAHGFNLQEVESIWNTCNSTRL